MTLDQQCQAARDRIAQFVNRSAAQHLRAWRERWHPQRTVYVETDVGGGAVTLQAVRVGLLELQRMLGRE